MISAEMKEALTVLKSKSNKKTSTICRIIRVPSYKSYLYGGPLSSELDLMDACKRGDLKTVKFYISNGCNLNYQSYNYETPLLYACLSGNVDTVKYLIEEKDLNSQHQGYKMKTPLSYACLSGNLDLVKYLIEEQGIDPNYQCNVSLLYMFDAVVGQLATTMANLNQMEAKDFLKFGDTHLMWFYKHYWKM